MDLSRVILGQIVTEKAENLKTRKTYTLRVDPRATKIDVKKALKQFYDVDVSNVRVIRARPKTRAVHSLRSDMEKRHRMKKALVTLAPKSKVLDITSFKTR